MDLSPVQLDRVAGVLVGQAIGDALGVPYEFGPRIEAGAARMIGGGLGPYEPGEWSDDTQMAICVARVAATGADLSGIQALNAIAAAFHDWADTGATDIGVSTRAVLDEAWRSPALPGMACREAAEAFQARTQRGASNGALMRTSVVGLTRLDDRQVTARAARTVAQLTHADPRAAEACVLWSEAVRVAVVEGRFDLAGGLDLLPDARRATWEGVLETAERGNTEELTPNGFIVTALESAWWAITSTDDGTGGCDHVERALQVAISLGDDTDTVAAVAGGLLGARYGKSKLPTAHVDMVHGWPGLSADDLADLAVATARTGLTSGAAGNGKRPA